MKTLRHVLLGVLAGWVFLLAGPASAQPIGASGMFGAEPRVEGFDIERVAQLSPGTALNFTLFGTPGAAATLRIDGADRRLFLEEVQAGLYEGTYTISERDRITPDSRVTANLRLGNQVATSVLDEPLLLGESTEPIASWESDLPRIDRFDVLTAAGLGIGSQLAFRLIGTPGGQASVTIDGVRGKLLLSESRSGEYTGTYVIRGRDFIDASSVVTASLRVGERLAVSTLGKPLHDSSAVGARAVRSCLDCGVVEAINPVEVRGDGGYLGTVAGGVVGAILGSQVGKGDGRTAGAIIGAVGGAYAGREIERNARRSTYYEVVVRLQNGGVQTISYKEPPPFRIGDRVTIAEGALLRRP